METKPVFELKSVFELLNSERDCEWCGEKYIPDEMFHKKMKEDFCGDFDHNCSDGEKGLFIRIKEQGFEDLYNESYKQTGKEDWPEIFSDKPYERDAISLLHLPEARENSWCSYTHINMPRALGWHLFSVFKEALCRKKILTKMDVILYAKIEYMQDSR